MLKQEFSIFFLVLFIITAMTGCAVSRNRVRESNFAFPDYILDEDRETLNIWLKEHSELKLALDSDCRCNNLIAQMNEWAEYHGTKGNAFHPYYVSGDFNFDGNMDFAAAFIDVRRQENNFVLVIFNGPVQENKLKKLAYVLKSLNLKEGGLFYGPPRPKPWMLMYAEEGQTETESDSAFVAKGDTYEYKPVVQYNEDGTAKELFP